LITVNIVCEICKEKFENNELPKCDKCGRLQNKTDISLLSFGGKCDCEEEEKELPSLPHEGESTSAFYERQINSLREELTTAEETIEVEREVHEDFMKTSEVWSKRQKQELLDRIKELEAEVERLKELTPQELLDEVSKLKERVKQLEEKNNQLTAQMEVKETKKMPW